MRACTGDFERELWGRRSSTRGRVGCGACCCQSCTKRGLRVEIREGVSVVPRALGSKKGAARQGMGSRGGGEVHSLIISIQGGGAGRATGHETKDQTLANRQGAHASLPSYAHTQRSSSTCEEEERERCTGKKAAAATSRFLPCRRPAREFQRAFGQGKKGERDKGAVRVGKNRGECP